MTRTPAQTQPVPCIWMSAGLVTYKLCDRGFDCERCPLDLALSGNGAEPRRVAPPSAVDFPEGPLYTRGHTWLRPAGEEHPGRWRFGIDAFAALLVGYATGFDGEVDGDLVPVEAPLGRLRVEAGEIPIAAPVAARVRRVNPALAIAPELAVREPYERGWLLELALERPPDVAALLGPEGAREQAGLDLRHFRRRIALELLAEADGVGPTLADGGERLTDLRRVLGDGAYLRLLRELIR